MAFLISKGKGTTDRLHSGGLGLTGGIVDIEGLFDCLRGIHTHVASPSILSTYSSVRIQRWRDIINPISSSNIRRMFALDPDKALEEDEFLKTVKKAEEDRELSVKMQTASTGLKYDFTQHYERQSNGVEAKDEQEGGEKANEPGRIDAEQAVGVVAATVT